MVRSMTLLSLLFVLSPAAVFAQDAQPATPAVAVEPAQLTARQRYEIVKQYMADFPKEVVSNPTEKLLRDAEYWFNAYIDEKGEGHDVPELFRKAYPVILKLSEKGYVTLETIPCRTRAIEMLVRIFKEGLGDFTADVDRAKFYEKLADLSRQEEVKLAEAEIKPEEAVAEPVKKDAVDQNRYTIVQSVDGSEGVKLAKIRDNNAPDQSKNYGVATLDKDGKIASILYAPIYLEGLWIGPYPESKHFKHLCTKDGKSYKNSTLQGQPWVWSDEQEMSRYKWRLKRTHLDYSRRDVVVEVPVKRVENGEFGYWIWKCLPSRKSGVSAKRELPFNLYDHYRSMWE